MKLRLASTLLCLPITMACFSACGPSRSELLIPPMHEVDAITELIDQEVVLTVDQRSQVRAIVADNAAMHDRIVEQFSGRIIELKEHEKTRLKKFDRQVSALLTEDQLKAWNPLFREIFDREMGNDDIPGWQEQQNNPDYRRHDDFGG